MHGNLEYDALYFDIVLDAESEHRQVEDACRFHGESDCTRFCQTRRATAEPSSRTAFLASNHGNRVEGYPR